MAMITLEHYGVTGSGRTVKEAKAAAGVKIARLVANGQTPYILKIRWHVGIVTANAEGFQYSIIAPDHKDGRQFHCCMTGDTREECISSMESHLAQYLDATEAEAKTFCGTESFARHCSYLESCRNRIAV